MTRTGTILETDERVVITIEGDEVVLTVTNDQAKEPLIISLDPLPETCIV